VPPTSNRPTCTAGVAERIAKMLREVGRSESCRALKLVLIAAER